MNVAERRYYYGLRRVFPTASIDGETGKPGDHPAPDMVKLEEWRKVMTKSHASESFSHFIIALVGALVIVGAAAWTFVAVDDHGCSSGVPCRSAAQMQQVHY